jgi:tetratricopeptide (TPR) repeat protein
MTKDNCETIEEMMSQRLYEALAQDEESRVVSHLETCAQCTQEWGKMQAWAKAIPGETPSTQFDLWPSVRSSMAEPKGFVFPWKRLVVSGVMGFGVGIIGLNLLGRFATPDSPVQVAEQLNAPFEKVESLRSAFQFQEARTLLAGWLQLNPNASDAGKALMTLARISFEDQENYPQAYEDYKQLRTQYPDEFSQDVVHVYRLNLLDEARNQSTDYTVLYRLARAKETGSIVDLEKLIVDYPGSFTADEAVVAMVESASLNTDENDVQLAMASLLEQCSHPVALTHVQLGIANHYKDQSSHSEMVVGLYETVAEGTVPELAQRARQQLAKYMPQQ